MNFKQTLNELEDIPITQFKPNPKDSPERVEPRKQEVDRTGSRFSINNYELKHGKVTAKSEEELETKLDKLVADGKNRMLMVYNYSTVNDTFVGHVVFYDRNVTNLEEKYQNALKNKIETFANERSKGKANDKVNSTVNKTKIISNIQKTLERLSDKSLKDVAEYANILARKDSSTQS